LDAIVISERGGTTYSSTRDLSPDLSPEEVRQVVFEAAVMCAGPLVIDADFGSGRDMQVLGSLVELGNLRVTELLAEAEKILRSREARRQRHALERALLERKIVSGPDAEAILEAA